MSTAMPDIPLRQSGRVLIKKEQDLTKPIKKENERRKETKEKKRKLAKDDSNSTRSLIDSYLTEIKDLKNKVDELKRENSEFKEYTWEMVKNPVITISIFYKSCSIYLLFN